MDLAMEILRDTRQRIIEVMRNEIWTRSMTDPSYITCDGPDGEQHPTAADRGNSDVPGSTWGLQSNGTLKRKKQIAREPTDPNDEKEDDQQSSKRKFGPQQTINPRKLACPFTRMIHGGTVPSAPVEVQIGQQFTE